MEIFLVGGAVRDFLLAKNNGELKTLEEEQEFWNHVEKDWVVVGSTPEEMLRQGYRPVGKSFPVFLHPETQEEYALARTERKTGKGYTGFECYAGDNVTLEEDLKRRDLTINAIAAVVDLSKYHLEKTIDPYQGKEDIKFKIFRHVSEAFAEDPVRILRLARLATRFGDFSVHPETQKLMEQMVDAGEVDALIPERVWQEWYRSLGETSPWRFFEILDSCNALKRLFPEITSGDFKKTILMRAHNQLKVIKFAIQLHDVEETLLRNLLKRYRIPSDFQELSLLVSRYQPMLKKENLSSEDVLALLEKTDAFRRSSRFDQFLTTCCYLEEHKSQRDKIMWIKEILNNLLKIDNTPLLEKGFSGKDFAHALRQVRLEKIDECVKNAASGDSSH